MCISCKGKLSIAKTDYIENSNNVVVLVKAVPCEKCRQCGETYFDHSTVQTLERVLNKFQHISSEITLTVMDYEKSAA